MNRKKFLAKASTLHPTLSFKVPAEIRYDHAVKCICPIHGLFSIRCASLLTGRGCQQCGQIRRQTAQLKSNATYVKQIKVVHGARYDYSQVQYGGKNTHVKIICKVHGVFSQRARRHLAGANCPRCTLIENGKLRRDRQAKIIQVTHGFDTSTYRGMNAKMTMTCKIHGEYLQEPSSRIAKGYGCPRCAAAKRISLIEQRVSAWVSKFTTVKNSDRSALRARQEIDIYCPEQRLGIEVNGTFWHSEQHKDKLYHYNKAVLARRASVTLLQFWEHELHERRRICQSIIRSHLNQNTRYYARQLEIREFKGANFFNATHLQGNAGATVTYGLFDGEQCLAAMSFGRPRMTRDCEWEIVRFANALDTTVVGGASRLFKHFLKQHNPQSIVSYADLRISQGQLYRTLGFQFSHVSAPNYEWIKGSKRLKRYQTQKHKLQQLLGATFDASLSETANMQAHNWTRLHDAGNLVYKWSAVAAD
jgi:very-short-patch-repair endonuclease